MRPPAAVVLRRRHVRDGRPVHAEQRHAHRRVRRCLRLRGVRSRAARSRGLGSRSLAVLVCLTPSYLPRSVALTPYLLLKRADASCTTDDASDENPVDGHALRFRWLRSGSRVRSSGGFCNVHPGAPATLQSVQFKTFHCSSDCFIAAWNEAARTRGIPLGESPLQPCRSGRPADAAPARAQAAAKTAASSTTAAAAPSSQLPAPSSRQTQRAGPRCAPGRPPAPTGCARAHRSAATRRAASPSRRAPAGAADAHRCHRPTGVAHASLHARGGGRRPPAAL